MNAHKFTNLPCLRYQFIDKKNFLILFNKLIIEIYVELLKNDHAKVFRCDWVFEKRVIEVNIWYRWVGAQEWITARNVLCCSRSRSSDCVVNCKQKLKQWRNETLNNSPTCDLLGPQEAFDDCNAQVMIFISRIPTNKYNQTKKKMKIAAATTTKTATTTTFHVSIQFNYNSFNENNPLKVHSVLIELSD